MSSEIDLREARQWILQHCHHASVRHVIERGLEYSEAVHRAGLCTDNTGGDELYQFLTAPEAELARARSFVQPTL
ncbi:MAG: hypothetical protein U1A27_12395 [Phycisphaerae bacterium]